MCFVRPGHDEEFWGQYPAHYKDDAAAAQRVRQIWSFIAPAHVGVTAESLESLLSTD